MKAENKTWFKRLLKWWHGEVKVDEAPGFVAVYRERHWTSKTARNIVSFYVKHWQWIWSTLIALAALVVSIKAI